MKRATVNDLDALDRRAKEMADAIRRSRDETNVSGAVHYVAADGDDANDGLSPARPWRGTARVSGAALAPGLFKKRFQP